MQYRNSPPSAINTQTESNLHYMPVDKELALEYLKWIEPEVYRVYARLRYRGMSCIGSNNGSKKISGDYVDKIIKMMVLKKIHWS